METPPGTREILTPHSLYEVATPAGTLADLALGDTPNPPTVWTPYISSGLGERTGRGFPHVVGKLNFPVPPLPVQTHPATDQDTDTYVRSPTPCTSSV